MIVPGQNIHKQSPPLFVNLHEKLHATTWGRPLCIASKGLQRGLRDRFHVIMGQISHARETDVTRTILPSSLECTAGLCLRKLVTETDFTWINQLKNRFCG